MNTPEDQTRFNDIDTSFPRPMRRYEDVEENMPENELLKQEINALRAERRALLLNNNPVRQDHETVAPTPSGGCGINSGKNRRGVEEGGYCFADLERKILDWSKARGIIQNGKAESQLLKTISEVGELADAFAKQDEPAIQDAVGDILVCLVNFCELSGFPMLDCLAGAYDQIKDRKGYLNSNGIFVKE